MSIPQRCAYWHINRFKFFKRYQKLYPYAVELPIKHEYQAYVCYINLKPIMFNYRKSFDDGDILTEIFDYLDNNIKEEYVYDWLFADMFFFKNKQDAVKFKRWFVGAKNEQS